MVILKNIIKTKADISADYYIEGREPKGFMKISIVDGEVLEHENAGYGSVHVKYELRRLTQVDNPPKEKTVLWY